LEGINYIVVVGENTNNGVGGDEWLKLKTQVDPQKNFGVKGILFRGHTCTSLYQFAGVISIFP
jgi:hypothetical protein